MCLLLNGAVHLVTKEYTVNGLRDSMLLSTWSLLVLSFISPKALRPVGKAGTKKTAFLEKDHLGHL